MKLVFESLERFEKPKANFFLSSVLNFVERMNSFCKICVRPDDQVEWSQPITLENFKILLDHFVFLGGSTLLIRTAEVLHKKLDLPSTDIEKKFISLNLGHTAPREHPTLKLSFSKHQESGQSFVVLASGKYCDQFPYPSLDYVADVAVRHVYSIVDQS